jgi:hypothetical protein
MAAQLVASGVVLSSTESVILNSLHLICSTYRVYTVYVATILGVRSWREIAFRGTRKKELNATGLYHYQLPTILEIMALQLMEKAEIRILWRWPPPPNYWRLVWLHQSRTPFPGSKQDMSPISRRDVHLSFPVCFPLLFFICLCQVVIKWHMSWGEIYIVLPAQLLFGKFNYVKLAWTPDKSFHPLSGDCRKLLSVISLLFSERTDCGLIETSTGNSNAGTERMDESTQSE